MGQKQQWQLSSTTTVRRVADSRSASHWSKEGSISKTYRLHSPLQRAKKKSGQNWEEIPPPTCQCSRLRTARHTLSPLPCFGTRHARDLSTQPTKKLLTPWIT